MTPAASGIKKFDALGDFAILVVRRKNGAGDEARTRNFQLGKLNFHSFIFNTYKTLRKKSAGMPCILCMQCLICVSLGRWGMFSCRDQALWINLWSKPLTPRSA
jgi:hypothetical protein